jgi:hypothetical protein
MKMADYLAEIEYAGEHLIPPIWQERSRFQTLEKELAALTGRMEFDYQRAQRAAAWAETADDVAEATGMYWDTYFGVDKERYYKDKDRATLADRIIAIRLSLDSVAGALLQFAKQGISLCHGDLGSCPDGRPFGTQFLKTVIWQGRNQALHWEDHTFNQSVQDCFKRLSTEMNPVFGGYTKRNMSLDVVELLGWTNFTKFKDDMLLLS